MASLPRSSISQPTNAAQSAGAQLAIDSFKLPDFPPQAQGLMALTLASAIKPEEYQELVTKAVEIPSSLPKGLQSLTLDHFTEGYPPGFLAGLAQRLPNLKSLVLYEQTIGQHVEDRLFFDRSVNLRALHLIDVYFANPEFVTGFAPALRDRTEKGLMFLEVNYTYTPASVDQKQDAERQSRSSFLERIAGRTLPQLISPSLITLKLNVSTPENVVADNDLLEVFGLDLSPILVEALTADNTKPRPLKALNMTLYTLSIGQLKTVCQNHSGLMILNATISISSELDNRQAIVEALSFCPDLEQVELVCNPSKWIQDPPKASAADCEALYHATLPSQAEMKKISEKCMKLIDFKANIMRSTRMSSLEWRKYGGQWIGGINHSKKE